MSSHKRSFKRPFQPSISSYFGQTRNSDCSPATASQNSILSPILPNTVQSSLLNVGMRVRKAVPDGYMTKPKTFCGFSMPFDGSASQSERSTYHSRSASSGLSNLLPYCGTLQVGGHAMQQVVPAEEDIPPLQFDPDDWGFPSSQESNASTIPTTCMVATPSIPPRTTNSNKRRREDADEEDLDLDSQPVSPRSRPISHTRMPNLDQVRPIAIPRSRRKIFQTGEGEIKESEMIDVGDFGEAEFFRPDAWGGGWEILGPT